MENQNMNNAPRENYLGKSKTFLSSTFSQYARVWRLLKKPTRQEFQTIAKISTLGLLLIGAIGFIISVAITLIRK